MLLEPRARRQAGRSGGSRPPSGPTPPGSTSASAATSPSSTTRRVVDARRSRGRGARDEVHRRGGRGDGPPDGDRRRRRRDGRGRAPAQRRHQRRHPRARRPLPRTGSSAPRSARTRSPGWPAGSRWTAASRPSSSSCTPTSCGSPPTSCSTRSARRGTCTAESDGVPLVLRSKVAMGTGYGSQHSMDPAGRLRHRSRLADRRAVHPVRLRGADEHRPALRGPGRRARARRPLQQLRTRPGRRPRLLPAGRQGRGPSGGRGPHGARLPGDGAVRARGGRGVREGRRRGDRPALARPGQHRLGHDRGEHPQDQPGADRRAGRGRHVVRRRGWPTRSSAASSTGSTRRSHRVDRRGGVAEHQQGPRARRDRPEGRGHRRARRDRGSY